MEQKDDRNLRHERRQKAHEEKERKGVDLRSADNVVSSYGGVGLNLAPESSRSLSPILIKDSLPVSTVSNMANPGPTSVERTSMLRHDLPRGVDTAQAVGSLNQLRAERKQLYEQQEQLQKRA